MRNTRLDVRVPGEGADYAPELRDLIRQEVEAALEPVNVRLDALDEKVDRLLERTPDQPQSLGS